jgi:hypothetical protein
MHELEKFIAEHQGVVSLVTLAAVLWVRAALADLHTQITKEQEARCTKCRDEFVSQDAFDQLDTRVTHVEERV